MKIKEVIGMKIVKRLGVLLLGLTMLPCAAFATETPWLDRETNDVGVLDAAADAPVIRNVRFLTGAGVGDRGQDTREVFSINEVEDKKVGALVTLSNHTDQEVTPVTLVLAGYDETNALTCVAVTNTASDYVRNNDKLLYNFTKAVPGLPTVNTLHPLTITDDTVKVRLLVWSGMDSLTPLAADQGITDSFELGKKSRDNRITGFSLDLAGNTYTGLINQDLKTIRLYVPTLTPNKTWNNSDASKYSNDEATIAGGSPITADNIRPDGYREIAETTYTTEVSAPLTPTITTGDSLATVDKTQADFTEAAEFTVTAVNGEKATYKVQLESLYVALGENFNEAGISSNADRVVKLNTQYTAEEITELAGGELAGKLNPDDWRTKSDASNMTSGMFSTAVGKSSWEYSKASAVTFAKSDSDSPSKMIGFEDNSPTKIAFKTEDSNRYASIGSINNGSDRSAFGIRGGSSMGGRGEMFYAFDFKVEDGLIGTNRMLWVSTKYFQLMISKDIFQARVGAKDNNCNGSAAGYASSGGYTSVRRTFEQWQPKVEVKNGWNKVAAVVRMVPGFGSGEGKMMALSEIYLNGEYLGYTYANDLTPYEGGTTTTDQVNIPGGGLDGDISKSQQETKVQDLMKFTVTTGVKDTYGVWDLDNVMVGTPYVIKAK